MAETQSERWLKYGSNTAVVTAVVVLLAAAVIYLAQKTDRRYDTTAAALYTLKPQTIAVIAGNKQPITITSFYTKAKLQDAAYGTARAAADAEQSAAVDRQADVVADLLQEYAGRGKNITVETIDPKLQPSKADALIARVTDKYGGEVNNYKTFIDALPKRFDAIDALATAERAKVTPLRAQLPDTRQMARVAELLGSVGNIPDVLKQDQARYQQLLAQKPPDYKGIALSVTEEMDSLSTDLLGRMIDGFKASGGDPSVPPPLRQYMTGAVPAYEKLKAAVDALSKDAKGLGELKLDTIREALRQDNAILVQGQTDWKLIPYDQVWQNDGRDLRAGTAKGAAALKPRFAGEQQVTAAIYSLQQPRKPKLCFVRAGGPPLAAAGGDLSRIAARLRDYNVDVTEKDTTGQWQQQAMQMGQPAAPEPADADVDDAVWVVRARDARPTPNPMMGGPPPGGLADKVAAHVTGGHHVGPDGKLAPGGSVLVLGEAGGDAMTAALAPFGVKLRADAVAVHKFAQNDDAAADAGDQINQILKTPGVFEVTQWGRSPITDTLAGLPGVLLNAAPVELDSAPPAAKDAKPTLIVPVPGAPDNPPCWGETDLQAADPAGPTFDKATDVAPPLFAAAVSERPDGSRAVVVGSGLSFVGRSYDPAGSTVIDYPDPNLRERGIIAPRFPGNAELFMNATFWLTHQEPMIAISPAAMTVSRIGPMTRPMSGFWHVGVLLIGLPGLVLAAGAAAYLSRRD